MQLTLISHVCVSSDDLRTAVTSPSVGRGGKGGLHGSKDVVVTVELLNRRQLHVAAKAGHTLQDVCLSIKEQVACALLYTFCHASMHVTQPTCVCVSPSPVPAWSLCRC